MEPSHFSKDRTILLALIGAFSFLLFFQFPNERLFDPDEARYAQIPRELIRSKDWLTFRLNGTAYFEKPPLLYWLNAAAMSVFGETPWAARLPTRLAAFGTVLLLIFFAGSRAPPLAGLWAGLFYISALVPFGLGRINLTDGILSFFLTLTFLLVRDYFATSKRAALIGVAAALAMLAKGLIAVVLPGLVVIVWAALAGRLKNVVSLIFSSASVVFLAITVPVFALVEQHNPGFSHFFFIREHFQRYSTGIHERTGPVTYFVPVLIGGFLPWTAAWLAAIRASWSDRGDRLYYFVWAALPFLFFSFSNSKLIPYVLPCFPAMAALTGVWAAGRPTPGRRFWMGNAVLMTALALAGLIAAPRTALLERVPMMPEVTVIALCIAASGWAAYFLRGRIERALQAVAVCWLGVVLTVVYIAPRLASEYSDGDLATAIQETGGTVVCYKGYSHGLRWYLDRDISVVAFKGELASDGALSDDRFWTLPEFWKRWNSTERIVARLPRRGPIRTLDDFRLCPTPPVFVAQNHHSILIANR